MIGNRTDPCADSENLVQSYLRILGYMVIIYRFKNHPVLIHGHHRNLSRKCHHSWWLINPNQLLNGLEIKLNNGINNLSLKCFANQSRTYQIPVYHSITPPTEDCPLDFLHGSKRLTFNIGLKQLPFDGEWYSAKTTKNTIDMANNAYQF